MILSGFGSSLNKLYAVFLEQSKASQIVSMLITSKFTVSNDIMISYLFKTIFMEMLTEKKKINMHCEQNGSDGTWYDAISTDGI